MNNQLIKINNTDLQVKEFKGQRIVTLKDIDTLHQRPEGTAGRNFRENRKHFIKDEDYFSLKGEELKEFKQTADFVGSTAKEIILILESGYLMIVKSLQDDLAWKVQRELVNNYFKVKENNVPINLETMQGMAFLSENMAVIGQGVQALSKFTVGLKEYVQDSIQAKDSQIEQAMNLIGIRCKNTRRLISKLKDAIFNKYGDFVPATDIKFITAKDKVFKEFKVYKWEDIPVTKYNAVEAFIENMFD